MTIELLSDQQLDEIATEYFAIKYSKNANDRLESEAKQFFIRILERTKSIDKEFASRLYDIIRMSDALNRVSKEMDKQNEVQIN
jgi:hypothetical protein